MNVTRKCVLATLRKTKDTRAREMKKEEADEEVHFCSKYFVEVFVSLFTVKVSWICTNYWLQWWQWRIYLRNGPICVLKNTPTNTRKLKSGNFFILTPRRFASSRCGLCGHILTLLLWPWKSLPWRIYQLMCKGNFVFVQLI